MFVAVTGASGHLGANVVRLLIQHNHKVRVLVHRNTCGIDNLPLEHVTADILDLNSLKSAFAGVDTVIHLAGLISILAGDRARIEAINVTGVKNMTRACLSSGVKRVIHISTIHAHKKEPLKKALDETRPLVDDHHAEIYDSSKAQGEQIIMQAINDGLNAIIINPTGIIGPYDFEPSHFGAALLALARGDFPVSIGGGFDWVDARDVAEGILKATLSAPAGEKYLLSGHWVSVHDVAQEVCRFMGKKPPVIELPLWFAASVAPLVTAYDRLAGKRSLFTTAAVKALNSNRSISHAKASRDFGYQPRPFADTISDTLDWFQKNGMLQAKKDSHVS
jgi:dihydroflavonol-4-reductase